jgi:hypothetical protein
VSVLGEVEVLVSVRGLRRPSTSIHDEKEAKRIRTHKKCVSPKRQKARSHLGTLTGVSRSANQHEHTGQFSLRRDLQHCSRNSIPVSFLDNYLIAILLVRERSRILVTLCSARPAS